MKKQFYFGRSWLIGRYDKSFYYLEPASWDCGWYWGFGYIEEYYNNRNHIGHFHADNLIEWFFRWNGKEPYLKKTPFSEKEKWQLVELFCRFYIYENLAELLYRGHTNVVPNIELEADLSADVVNRVWIPRVIAKIYCILDPEPKSEKEYFKELVSQVD